jgi:hypothetical protein
VGDGVHNEAADGSILVSSYALQITPHISVFGDELATDVRPGQVAGEEDDATKPQQSQQKPAEPQRPAYS